MKQITWDMMKEFVLTMYKNKQLDYQQTISIQGDEYDLEVRLTKRRFAI